MVEPGSCDTLGSIFSVVQKKPNKLVEQFKLSSTDSKIINKMSSIHAIEYYSDIKGIGKKIVYHMDTP